MNKASLVATLTFFGATGLMALICANSHIDFFPCNQTTRDFAHADPFTGEAKLVTKPGTCSLMDHLRDQADGQKDELTGAGWALLVAFCVGFGVVDSAVIYTVLSRKTAKPTA